MKIEANLDQVRVLIHMIPTLYSIYLHGFGSIRITVLNYSKHLS